MSKTPPKAAIDRKNRIVLIEQEHDVLVGQPQRIVVSFMFLKKLVGQLIAGEAVAEAVTGDPRAVVAEQGAQIPMPPQGGPT